MRNILFILVVSCVLWGCSKEQTTVQKPKAVEQKANQVDLLNLNNIPKFPTHWINFCQQGIDTRVGYFKSKNLDLQIYYDIGPLAGEYAAIKPYKKYQWIKRAQLNGIKFNYLLNDDNILYVTFVNEGPANYWTKIKDSTDINYTLELLAKYRKVLLKTPTVEDLRSVLLKFNKIKDDSRIEDMIRTTVMSLSKTECSNTDLASLVLLNRMISLDISYTLVSDISPLAAINGLVILDISHTELSDISALTEMKQLITLDLRSTNVTDLTPLVKLNKLVLLRLTGSKITQQKIQKLKKALPNITILME
jgi:hypothetical protein